MVRWSSPRRCHAAPIFLRRAWCGGDRFGSKVAFVHALVLISLASRSQDSLRAAGRYDRLSGWVGVANASTVHAGETFYALPGFRERRAGGAVRRPVALQRCRREDPVGARGPDCLGATVRRCVTRGDQFSYLRRSGGNNESSVGTASRAAGRKPEI